jgi:hypothetical protein
VGSSVGAVAGGPSQPAWLPFKGELVVGGPGRFIEEATMAHQIWALLLDGVTFAVFLGFGVLCTFYPHVVQKLDKIGPINLRPPFKFLRRHVASPQYISQTRIGGIVALLGAAFLLYTGLQLVIELIRQ